MTTTRRDFLLKMAKGAAYAAPVVYTLAAPAALLGQENTTSTKGGMGMGMTKDLIAAPIGPASNTPSPVPPAPWAASPSSKPPGR